MDSRRMVMVSKACMVEHCPASSISRDWRLYTPFSARQHRNFATRSSLRRSSVDTGSVYVRVYRTPLALVTTRTTSSLDDPGCPRFFFPYP